MPQIRPISDLCNKFNEIEEICHQEGEPVFITKNGKGDLVVMSLALYEKQQALLQLYEKLAEAEEESRSNPPRATHQDLMELMRKRLNEQ